MTLSELIEREHIFLKQVFQNKSHFFEQVAKNFSSTEIEKKLIFSALSEREEMGSTGIGEGIAIPHGRVAHLKSPRMGFYQMANPGIDFAAIDGKPVQLAFVVLVPENATQSHLLILSQVANLVSQEKTRLNLLSSDDTDQILQIFHAHVV